MAANGVAMFAKQIHNSGGGFGSTAMSPAITLAANDFTGVSANNVLVATFDANNGGYLLGVTLKAMGTNVATVMRFFLNNGLTNTSAANNSFIKEVALAATTASATAVTSADIYIPFNLPIQKGFRIYAGLATAVAAGWNITTFAGDF